MQVYLGCDMVIHLTDSEFFLPDVIYNSVTQYCYRVSHREDVMLQFQPDSMRFPG